MKTRIALVSAASGRRDGHGPWPHYGLTLLATVLNEAGYEARVFDQSYLRMTAEKFVATIRGFAPSLVGVCLYTAYVRSALALIKEVQAALPGCRAIAGGPHVSLYAEEMREDATFAALVKGEADRVVADIVGRVLRGETPGILSCELPAGADIPVAAWRVAEGHDTMQWLPMQLSRGCPFNCSFCEVRAVASRKIRYRDANACLDEIEDHLRLLPLVHTIRIVDDCPTLDRQRFKAFLKEYLRRGLTARIQLDNLRADSLDEELVDLLKRCRTPSICIGVESGNPEVFQMVDKAETLDEIREAASLVRKKKIPLHLCFVVGLPGSTFEAEMDSLRLAKSLKPERIYWNMFLPHRGTRAREWYETHGTLYDEWDVSSVPDYNLRYTLPPAETVAFRREDRIRAWLKCVIETGSFLMLPAVILRALYLSARYGLWSSIPPLLVKIPQTFFIQLRQKVFSSVVGPLSRWRLARRRRLLTRRQGQVRA